MKTGTTSKVKFQMFMRDLQVPLYEAVGILESLWQLTSENAPRGDIGRFSDSDLAGMIGYAGDSTKLIETLVKRGWLDSHPKHRLVVHDWPDHGPDFVKKRIERSGKGWACDDDLSDNGGQRRTTAASGRQRRVNPTQPNPTKPNPTVPNPEVIPLVPLPEEEPRLAAGREEDNPVNSVSSKYTKSFEAFWNSYPAHRRVKKAKAFEAWKRAKIKSEDIPKVMESLERQKISHDWQKDGGQFVPHPTTWINNRRWEDDPEASKAASGGASRIHESAGDCTW